jgi:hypothetical protein
VKEVLQTADEKNRTNQCNPDHKPSSPGHKAGYKGKGDKQDLDNHSNQLNPNNPEYEGEGEAHK